MSTWTRSPRPCASPPGRRDLRLWGTTPSSKLGEYRTRAASASDAFKPVLPGLSGILRPRIPTRAGTATRCRLRIAIPATSISSDTTTRDITQSNSGNRLPPGRGPLIGPYLDNCGFFSLENGGGAHFHVAMLANMTYPFTEAESGTASPQDLKQILIRSTNVLGYKPQPRNLMRLTGEMICEHYDVIRCFDFLNHVENMRPFAEVAMNSKTNIFEPAISLSWAKGFDVPHYLGVVRGDRRHGRPGGGVTQEKGRTPSSSASRTWPGSARRCS
jgi:pyruvate carboxylase